MEQGWKQTDAAEALGVTPGTVSRWVAQALRRRKPPGGPYKLSDAQLAQLPELLNRGPLAFGFCGEIWSRGRLAQVIERGFGVSHDPSQVGRILKRYGFSLQKPVLGATNGKRRPSGTGATGASQS